VALIGVLRGPAQRIRGTRVYAVLRSPIDADLVVVSESDDDLLFASGTTLVNGYHVETVRHWDDGVVPGITRLAFVAALPGATTFRQRYLAHAAIARAQHPAICRYIQHFVIRGSEPVCAAISELHFADEESMRTRFYRDDDSPSVVDADISDYLDRERTWSMLTRLVP
jgi:hypothetical protein